MMRWYRHFVAIMLALVVGVIAFVWAGRSHEPQIVPPIAGDAVPSVPGTSTRLEEETDIQPVRIDLEAAELTQRAINARSVGDIETAITLFELAISTDPANVVALSNYGRLLTLTFSLERAVEVLEAATVLQPSDAQVWLDLATAYERAQLFKDSRNAQAKAQALVGAEAITRDELGRFVVEGSQLQ